MGFDDTSSPTLVLGLGLGLGFPTTSDNSPLTKLDESAAMARTPSLTLVFSDEAYDHKVARPVKVFDKYDANPVGDLYRQDSGGVSTLSNVSVKREREFGSKETGRKISSRNEEEEEDDGLIGRKKLRLTKAQSALLEENFKYYTTLNPKRKQELARKLNLRPRQVEVWFQNRRARTKLKQTEVDCNFLKKCCETLKDENKRLHKELQELRAFKLAQPYYRQFPVAAATLTMCPSCERIGSGVDEIGSKIMPLPMSEKSLLIENVGN